MNPRSITSTLPSGSSVALTTSIGSFMFAIAVQVPVSGS